MKKIIYGLIGTLAAIAIIGYGGYKLMENSLSETPVAHNSKERTEITQKIEVEETEVVLKVTNDEDLEALFPDTMSEYEMQETIHFMSHGLVQANQKWGKIEMTEDRVERLLYVAERNADTYTHGSNYVKILERWNDGNFNNAVDDHNFVWGLWNGTVGKATRLLTPSEIEKYNAENFD